MANQRGYFSLWPNLATTAAANLAPLDHVPLVTTLFAYAVQLLPVAIILWSRAPIAVTFVGAYLLLTFSTYVAALVDMKLSLIVPGIGQRYFYVPNVIILLMVLVNLKPYQRRDNFVFVTLLLVALSWGTLSYRSTLIMDPDWPNWPAEIARWRADPQRTIQIWPAGWEIHLRTE